MKQTAMVFLLFVGSLLMAQANPKGQQQQHQATVQGCVSRLSGDYVLTQIDPGNTYVLHSSNHIRLAKYLGQQVEVTGTKSPTLNDSADSARSAPPVTITVNSISTVSKECKP
jgi:hypothetical protein